jgi:hypothetical protein
MSWLPEVKMTRKLILIECWLEQGPQGQPVTKHKPIRGPQKELGKVDIDSARKLAKSLVKDMGKSIRATSILRNGGIQIVYWRDGPPRSPEIAGWRWQRPPSSDKTVR